MEPQIGDLAHELARVARRASHVLGGHHDFGGFFADLLQEGVGALVQEAGDVAGLAGRRRWPACGFR